MTTLLYTAYHKAAPLLQSASICPIHVGRARAHTPLAGMIGDDTGAHISEQNPEYCELTALYWAWKNDTTSDHIGLMHYRRVLDFDGRFASDTCEVYPPRFDIPTWIAGAEAWLAQHQGAYDLIVPRAHVMGRSVAQNYRMGHAPGDLDLTRDIIARDHAAYLDSFDAVCAGRTIRLGNMFVMRRDLFQPFCAWLFDVLEKLAGADLERRFYSPTQRRYLGFVAERLLTVYVHHLAASQPDLRIKEVNIVNLSNALTTPYLNDDSLNGAAHINVAFAADRAYLPHTGAMLHSLLTQADPARQINLFFLFTDVGAVGMAMLQDVITAHPNAHLHAINAGDVFATSYRSASRAPSNATYNRFLLFDLLPGLDRLLYVDGDMIFHGDVAEIYDTEMGSHQIAAVPDYIMTRTLSGPTPTREPSVPDLYAYHRDVLGLSDAQIGRYFNAGLLLFNFGAMDVAATGAALMTQAETTQYLFRDQDILNRHFKDSYLPLPGRFNVFNTHEGGYSRVPHENHAAAMAARANPLVTHYAAGDYKPWLKRAIPGAQHYWNALIQTPFYGEVMSGHSVPQVRRAASHSALVRMGMELSTRVPALRPALLRIHRMLQRVLR